ncbi:MAG: DUF948 domain-containing protein [Candidatus Pacebacteria bacterium]|nr:DUF948 domain-containing protein [Candidatus Paceibacterota bacterium]
MRNNNESSNKWLLWSIAFLVLVILGIFGYFLSKEMKQKAEVDQQIQALENQADQIKKENMQLQERISYLGSQNYQKLEAKTNLDLQDPGEKVVVITPGPAQSGDAAGNVSPSSVSSPVVEQIPNWRKWWNYFF